MRRALFPFAALLLASGASPATAGHWRAHYADWWSIHQAIYERENRIAFLEADPETDDGYRAPIISRHARRDPAAACCSRSGAMAVDDAVLLQPPADLHRLVIASPAVPLASLSFRTSTPQVQAEDRRAAAAAAAGRAGTSR